MAAAPQHVLIVATDPAARQTLRSLLADSGVSVEHAASLDEGNEALRSRGCAVLVLTDAELRGSRQLLQSASAAQFPPVVFLAAQPDFDTSDVDAPQIHGVIRMPGDEAEVGNLIARCVQLQSVRSAGLMCVIAAMASSAIAVLNGC